MIDLYQAIGETPEEIVAWFESKGLQITWNWREMWEEANNLAFTVAGIAEIDVLETFRDITYEAIDAGLSLEQYQGIMTELLAAKGWVPGEGVNTPWRLETIYRTNLQSAYSVGRYRAMEEAKSILPYWQYIAVSDDATRDSHAALHKKIFRADDSIWNTWYPPNGFNCRCRVRAYSEGQIKKRGLKVEDGSKYASEIPDEGFNYNPGKVGAERLNQLLDEKRAAAGVA